MATKNKKIYKKSPNFVTRVIENETILLPLYKEAVEINCLYTLNEVGGQIWKLINGKRDLEEIKKILLREYDVKESEVEKKLNGFIKDLLKIKAIK